MIREKFEHQQRWNWSTPSVLSDRINNMCTENSDLKRRSNPKDLFINFINDWGSLSDRAKMESFFEFGK
jgi:hypothetical protein